MNDRWLISSFTASSLIHLSLISVAALVMQARPVKPITVPIELVDVPRVEEAKKVEVAPLPPQAPKRKPQNLTVPKLLSRPEIIESKPPTPAAGAKEEVKEPVKPVEERPKLAPVPENPGSAKGGWNMGNLSGETQGSASGAGNLFGEGDVGVVAGSGVEGGGGGRGTSGLGRETKGNGSGGGGIRDGFGQTLGLARPLGGYQVKPRYPESARRDKAQGVTLLKVRVLENGSVGETLIEQSAGHPDLDRSAADAVKRWRFEPARRGNETVAVWVLLPVRFQLQ